MISLNALGIIIKKRKKMERRRNPGSRESLVWCQLALTAKRGQPSLLTSCWPVGGHAMGKMHHCIMQTPSQSYFLTLIC
jgi:demethoxyubiquinone hydroxylase (CLK1/Coq7/Cat5 family)